MGNIQDIGRYAQFVAWGTSGNLEDVDRLMDELEMNDDLATTKLVDYALGLVETREGRAQLSHYLFNGSQRQRNFASLYFKRLGLVALLDEAVALGRIDEKQAYSKWEVSVDISVACLSTCPISILTKLYFYLLALLLP